MSHLLVSWHSSATMSRVPAPLRLAPNAEADLYELFSPFVARLAFRLLGRDGEIDDLVQDTFLEAFRNPPTSSNPALARKWLATIAVRLVGRKLRRRRIACFLGFDDGVHDEHLLAPGASPETQAIVKSVYQRLQGACQSRPWACSRSR